MGNTLTTASISTTNIIVPVTQQQVIKPMNMKESQSNPPLECPMHKPNQLNTINYTSKCPIDEMDGNDINPLNMV